MIRFDEMEEFTSLQFAGEDLDAKDTAGSSDPYFVVKDTYGKVVFKSETIKRSLWPFWKPFELPSDLVVGGGLTVEVWDWDRWTRDDFIGTAVVSPTVVDERWSLTASREMATLQAPNGTMLGQQRQSAPKPRKQSSRLRNVLGALGVGGRRPTANKGEQFTEKTLV